MVALDRKAGILMCADEVRGGPVGLGEAGRELLERPWVAVLGTVDADGAPHMTPVWFDTEGGNVVVNIAAHRRKLRNMRRNPVAAFVVVDPRDSLRAVALQGAVVEFDTAHGIEHLERLSRKYLGAGKYIARTGETRVKVVIKPTRILMQPMDG